MDRPVDQDPAHKAAHPLHVGQLGPLVRLGVVALCAAEDRLVLAEAARDEDLALVGHHRAAEPRLVHRGDERPLVGSGAVPLD